MLLSKTHILPTMWLSAAACVAILGGAPDLVSAKTRLIPSDVTSLWVNPQAPAAISWRVEDAPSSGTLEYALYDYSEKRISEGSAKITDGKLAVNVTLPAGFFYIDFPATQQHFGVVSIDPFQGEPDPYFCVNSILSWLVKKDATTPSRGDLVRIMRRSGISMAREGFGWRDSLQPTIDSWDWNGDADYDTLYQDYAANKVPLLMLFNTAPNHLGKAIGEGPNRMPLDMLGVDFSWRRMTDHFQSSWGAVEIWNEPDGSFGGGSPPDQYAPVAKAMAHAFTSQKSKAELVGAVAACGWDEQYYSLVAGNGLLNNMDAWSFHTYGHHTPKTMQGLVQAYRTAFAKDGVASMPLWNSESGSFWHNGADGADAAQDRQSALDITMRGVECLACGLTRYFPFVVPYYEEGPNNWGLMDRNGAPQRSMAAYVRSIELLARKPYVGDWRIGEAPLTRARVFADSKTSIVVLYAEKITPDLAVRIPLPKSGVEILGIDGRALALTADGRVPMPDGLTYLRITGSITPWLNTNTAAAELFKIGHKAPPQRPVPSPIVLQFRPDLANFYDPDPTGYCIRGDAPETIPFTINVNNLSETTQKVTVHIEGEGQRLPDQTLELPPRSVLPLKWDVRIAMAKRGGLNNIDYKVLATSTTAGRVDPMMIRFRGVPTVASLLGQFRAKEKFSFLDLQRWSPSALPGAVATISVPEFETWQLSMNFNDVKDRWSYPHYGMPSNVSFAKYKGIVFEGLCTDPAPAVRLAMWVWQNDATLAMFMTNNVLASDNKWHAVYVPFTAFGGSEKTKLDLSKVAMFSFGMNSGTATNELRIRNVWLVSD